MSEIQEEQKIAKAEKARKEAEKARKELEAAEAKILADKRAAKIGIQEKEFKKYSDWRFWATRLTFPDRIIKPNCVIYRTTKVFYQQHDWRDRYGYRESTMDSQHCWVPGSIAFNESGFKYIEIRAFYSDIGENPGGPREGGEWRKFQFPTYEIWEEHINCKNKKTDVRQIAELTKLLESDPESFDLGQGNRAERFLSTTDPVTNKRVVFSKPLWVIKFNHPRYSLGRVRHTPTLNKIVNPSCNAHRKFWSNKNFSG